MAEMSSANGSRGLQVERSASTRGSCPGEMYSRRSAHWQVLTRSIFAFADSQLEGLYQASLASWVSCYAWIYCGMNLIGWSSVLLKLARASSNLKALCPAILVPALGNMLPSLAVMTLVPLLPAVFRKHWRTINIVVSVLQMSTWNLLRQVLLWQQLRVGKDAGPGDGAQVRFQGTTFSVENFYFSCMSLRVLAFPTGQVSDLMLTSLAFLLTLHGNPQVCRSAVWDAVPARISFSGKSLMLIQRTTTTMAALFGASEDPGLLIPSPASLTCPAVLGFWEVAGWLFATLLAFMREIVSRRAFLKANAARLGQGGARRALFWPFGHVAMVQRCLCTLLFLFAMSIFLWELVLLAYN
jgi:hypothetical protein